MLIWFSLLIPILGIILLYIYFHKKVAWWEGGVLFLLILGFISIMKYSTELSMTSDKEYLQDYVVRVEYYEDWNEWITQTCTRSCCCVSSTDSKGVSSTKCGTESYDCSHEDYHGEYYQMITASGKEIGIEKETYYRLIKQFKKTPIFVDMNRDYYTNDGDKYYFEWNGDISSIEYTVHENTYENRVQASHSILNFPDVDTSDIRRYTIKEYPQVSNLDILSLLGDKNYNINRYINQTNSYIASNKQVKIFYLIFKNQPLDAGLIQEQYWKMGNKNEVNICIGIDSKRNIKWTYVFTWSKKDIVKVKIRDFINSNKILNNNTYKTIIDYSNGVIVKDFERRHFKEFSYLTVEPSDSAIIWTFVISFILTIGGCIFIVINPFDSDGMNYGNNNFNNRYGRY